MTATRKAKIIVAVLITLAVLVTPAAFSVSYARWTGGTDTLNGEFNVVFSGGGKPSEVVMPLPDNFGGGLLIRGEDGSSVAPGEHKDGNGNPTFTSYPEGGGTGFIYGVTGEYIYIQVFAAVSPDEEGAIETADKNGNVLYVKAVNYDIYPYGYIPQGVEHEKGSYWYKLPLKNGGGEYSYRYTISVQRVFLSETEFCDYVQISIQNN